MIHTDWMNGTAVQVTVEDTGPGVGSAVAERVFEPFEASKSDGMGMELTICRSIIEAHGGELWIGRNTGHGAHFHFTAPISSPIQ